MTNLRALHACVYLLRTRRPRAAGGRRRVLVEGVNIIKRHQRARSQNQVSQIVEREAPIHVSNVMLIDPNTDQPTRVTFRRRENGTLVRVGKRSGEDIE